MTKILIKLYRNLMLLQIQINQNKILDLEKHYKKKKIKKIRKSNKMKHNLYKKKINNQNKKKRNNKNKNKK